MNRDFESEYKQMIYDEAPDIWGSIEAKLGAQSIVPARKRFRWQYVALPAAAVLCAAIIIPVMINSHRLGKYGAYESEAVNTVTTADVAGEAAYYTDGAADEAVMDYAELETAEAAEAESADSVAETSEDNIIWHEYTINGDVQGADIMKAEAEEADADIAGEVYVLKLAEDLTLPELTYQILDKYSLKLVSYDRQLRECRVYFKEDIADEDRKKILDEITAKDYISEIVSESELE